MRTALVFLIAMLLCRVVHGATTQPATTQSLEAALAQHKRELQQEYVKQINDTPELKLPTGQVSDVFEMTIDKDLLMVRPKIGATDGQVRCTPKGFTGPCSVSVFAERNVPNGALIGMQFALRDFSNPLEVFRHTMLFAHAESVQLSMDLDGLVTSKSVSMIEDLTPEDPDSAVRLHAQVMDSVTDETIGQHSLSAPSFSELRRRYPRQTQEFVVPILRDLQQQAALAPDPRVAYQVLQTEFKPDEKLQKKLDAALAKFDSESFQERERAAQDLTELGQPAALALMRADRKGWSIDRSSGVDSFLAQYKALPADEVQRLRSDPAFLLDCLYSSDERIRASASEILLKSFKVEADADATGKQRDQIIDRAYARLFPPLTTKPTTQP